MSRAALARNAQRKFDLVSSGAADERVQADVGHRKGSIPLTVNDSYNFHNILWQHLRSSYYFRGLYKTTTFSGVLDKIYFDVEHCEPMVPSSRGPAASPCFCLVYKLFLMRLTDREMETLLTHGDSPFIRAVGLLYLRIATDVADLWRWFEPALHDHESMAMRRSGGGASGAGGGGRGGARSSAGVSTSLGDFAQLLLTTNKYFNTMLPPIPIPVMKRYKKRLSRLDEIFERAEHNRKKEDQFRPGMVIDAMFSDDFEWYEARIEARVGEGRFFVTYLPEAEYGNQEERTLGYLRLQHERAAGEQVGGGGGAPSGGASIRGRSEARSRSRSRSRDREDTHGRGNGHEDNNIGRRGEPPKHETAWQRHRREKREKKARAHR